MSGGAGEVADVLVTGAGAVGATAALTLARDGRSVTLIDARPGPTEMPGERYSEFVVALNMASIELLRQLDVWDEIHAFRASPYVAMELNDATGDGHTRFDSTEIGEPLLGYFVETALLEAVLHRALAAEPAVKRVWDTRPESVCVDTDRVTLTVDKGKSRSARLLVGADGARSRVRALAEIDADVHDYGQQAIVCNFSTELHHAAVARQRFLPGGPVAMLPLANGDCSLAWFRPEEEATRLLALDDAAFREALSEATGHMLGSITAAGPRRGYPIVRRHAREYVRRRVALIGDAAHVIHPLAGQGLNLGMLDVAVLADSLGQSDPGQWSGLRRYARWRRTHNTAVLTAMDCFHHGFGAGGPVRRLVRNAGMNLAQGAGPLKRAFIRMGAGISGDLPARLASIRNGSRS